MAKVLKTVGLVIGAVALVATGVGALAFPALAGTLTVAGVSTTTLFLAGAGLATVGGLLQKGPSIPSTQTQRLTVSIDPNAPRKTVLGLTAMALMVDFL